MYAIARDTGWTEDYIIWRLPLVRALQYYHCALQGANLWTLEPTTQETLAELMPATLVDFISGLDAEDDD